MCGIAGFVNGASEELARELADVSSAMDACLQHRGPDDHGVWVDQDCGVALVHRRLSILDLSPAGHQPMLSADGRFVIIYNGEIYSHQPIAAELAARGYHFRGHSDTEVIVNSFAENGIEPTLKRMIGMFAIALWDRRERSLILILGEIRQAIPVRLGAESTARASRLDTGNRSQCGGCLHASQLHPGPAYDLSWSAQA
jgi:asparagine synthase (glutamine-hydrolysing)